MSSAKLGLAKRVKHIEKLERDNDRLREDNERLRERNQLLEALRAEVAKWKCDTPNCSICKALAALEEK